MARRKNINEGYLIAKPAGFPGVEIPLLLHCSETDAKSAWARRLKERRHVNVAAVALAAKHARIAWAILAHGR